MARTRSPGLSVVTAGPTLATTPAGSLPGTNGRAGKNWYLADHQEIDEICGGGVDFQQHVLRPGRRRRKLADRCRLERAELANDDCTHAAPLIRKPSLPAHAGNPVTRVASNELHRSTPTNSVLDAPLSRGMTRK